MRSKAKPKFGGKRREHTDAFAHYIAGRRGAVETMASGRARALYVQTPVRWLKRRARRELPFMKRMLKPCKKWCPMCGNKVS